LLLVAHDLPDLCGLKLEERPFTFSGGSGTHVINNGTANYGFNFTVVPEPATALLGSLGMLALLRRRK